MEPFCYQERLLITKKTTSTELYIYNLEDQKEETKEPIFTHILPVRNVFPFQNKIAIFLNGTICIWDDKKSKQIPTMIFERNIDRFENKYSPHKCFILWHHIDSLEQNKYQRMQKYFTLLELTDNNNLIMTELSCYHKDPIWIQHLIILRNKIILFVQSIKGDSFTVMSENGKTCTYNTHDHLLPFGYVRTLSVLRNTNDFILLSKHLGFNKIIHSTGTSKKIGNMDDLTKDKYSDNLYSIEITFNIQITTNDWVYTLKEWTFNNFELVNARNAILPLLNLRYRQSICFTPTRIIVEGQTMKYIIDKKDLKLLFTIDDPNDYHPVMYCDWYSQWTINRLNFLSEIECLEKINRDILRIIIAYVYYSILS